MFVWLQVWDYIIKMFQSLKINRIFLIHWSHMKSEYLSECTQHRPLEICSFHLLFVPVPSLPPFPLIPCCDILGNMKPLYGFCHPHIQAEKRFLYQEVFFLGWTWCSHIWICLVSNILGGSCWNKNILFEKRCLIKLYPYTINHGLVLLD